MSTLAPAAAYPRSLQVFAWLADAGTPLRLERPEVAARFTQGWCGLYALALLEVQPRWEVRAQRMLCNHPGWSCVPIGEDCCAYSIAHLVAGPPGGPGLDAGGEHEFSGLAEISDSALVGLLGEWYLPYSLSLDGAATARDVVTRVMGHSPSGRSLLSPLAARAAVKL